MNDDLKTTFNLINDNAKKFSDLKIKIPTIDVNQFIQHPTIPTPVNSYESTGQKDQDDKMLNTLTGQALINAKMLESLNKQTSINDEMLKSLKRSPVFGGYAAKRVALLYDVSSFRRRRYFCFS